MAMMSQIISSGSRNLFRPLILIKNILLYSDMHPSQSIRRLAVGWGVQDNTKVCNTNTEEQILNRCTELGNHICWINHQRR
jgi:hypothetical protein